MRVLVACEESQTVCAEFRKLGHEAYSNDIQECSGGHPEWHLQMDCFQAIELMDWDLMIAHPPCTYLTNSGVCWLHKDPARWQRLDEGAAFFRQLLDAPVPKKCIENPIVHKYAKERIGRAQTQVVQPWMFGHMEQKATCLWLEGLPCLQPTKNVKDEMMQLPKRERERLHYLPPSADRWKLRSTTYQGIADAMAKQWG